MMRTLRDMNMSKFVAEDVPLFLSLIEDIFSGVKTDRAEFEDVTTALLQVSWVKQLSWGITLGHGLAMNLCVIAAGVQRQQP